MSENNYIQLDAGDPNIFKPILYKNLYTPSNVHGYVLAIELAKKWFINKFPDGYFKNVYVNGNHVYDDYKLFNKQTIKKDNPFLAIVPTLDMEYDRDTKDLYLGGPELYLRATDTENAFFTDPDKDSHILLRFKEQKMQFNFRVKVSTKAQQIDTYNFMSLFFKVGGTHRDKVIVEYHIPTNLMINLAIHSGFEVVDDTIKDPIGFLKYVNSRSYIPFIYKKRNMTGKYEFFIRIDSVSYHISTQDKLSADDGDRVGMLDRDFNIDMSMVMKLPVPFFFVYFSKKELYHYIPSVEVSTDILSLYTFSQFAIPNTNSKGWSQYVNSVYIIEPKEKEINMGDVLYADRCSLVIRDCLSKNISPDCFIDVVLYRPIYGYYAKLDCYMDYQNGKLILLDDFVNEEYLYLVVYMDLEFRNTALNTIEQLNGRIG